MIEWEDTSSWSRQASAETRKVSKEWTARIGDFTLIIHRHIHYPPDTWLVSSKPAFLTQVELSSSVADEAKQEAVLKLRGAALLMKQSCEQFLQLTGSSQPDESSDPPRSGGPRDADAYFGKQLKAYSD